MRTWDIIDNLEPNVQITVQKKNPATLVGSISSAVRTALIVTVAFASCSGAKFVRRSEIAAFGIPVQVKKASQSVSSAVVRGVVRDTDTQFGQSSSKLARAFPAFFQPASDEDEYDDDYSFA
jgi:hypothetical protein